MTRNSKSVLPCGLALAAVLMLGACGGKSQETVPAATNNSSVPSTVTNAQNSSAAVDGSYNEQEEQNEMERHHRQGMDHDEMRRGGQSPAAPAPAQQQNQSAPMQDM
jgi:hypothetical protein